jgi:hypothetical protein
LEKENFYGKSYRWPAFRSAETHWRLR